MLTFNVVGQLVYDIVHTTMNANSVFRSGRIEVDLGGSDLDKQCKNDRNLHSQSAQVLRPYSEMRPCRCQPSPCIITSFGYFVTGGTVRL